MVQVDWHVSLPILIIYVKVQGRFLIMCTISILFGYKSQHGTLFLRMHTKKIFHIYPAVRASIFILERDTMACMDGRECVGRVILQIHRADNFKLLSYLVTWVSTNINFPYPFILIAVRASIFYPWTWHVGRHGWTRMCCGMVIQIHRAEISTCSETSMLASKKISVA